MFGATSKGSFFYCPFFAIAKNGTLYKFNLKDMTQNMNYEESLDLLLKLSRNKNYVDLLRKKGESEKTWTSVKYDLSKYKHVEVQEVEKKEIAVSVQEQEVEKRFKKHTEKVAALPKDIVSIATNETDAERLNVIIARKNKCFKEASAMLHTLEFLSVEARKEAAEKILKGFDLIEKDWEIIDFYNENRKFPDFKAEKEAEKAVEIEEKQEDRALLVKRQITLRTYISKHEKALRNARTESEKTKISTKLNEFKLELESINTKLL